MRLLFCLSALLMGAGCTPAGPLVRDAPGGEIPTGYPNQTAEQVIAAVRASVAPVQSASADGDLRVEGPDDSQSATFSLRARLGDSLTAVVRGPLGIEGGRGLVTMDSFYVADRINRQFLLGPVRAADRYVPGAGSQEQIARAALGLLVPESDMDWSITPTDGLYRLVGRLPSGVGSREYTIDPALWRVVRVLDFDAGGQRVGRQTFEAFDTVDGLVLPRRVVLEGGETTVAFEHRRLAVNPPDLRLRFSRPEDYETIRVE
jgi:hypothetical protein